MNGQFRGKLILPKPEFKVCKLCGDTFPVNPGDTIDNCTEWVEVTLKRLPQPVDFSIMVGMKNFAKLCHVATHIKSGLEALADLESGR
jgi:hypothetical protein